MNFFGEINFQTFFIPQKPTELVFYISDIFFQSKVKIRNVHSILDFLDFHQHFLRKILKEMLVKIEKIQKLSVRFEM